MYVQKKGIAATEVLEPPCLLQKESGSHRRLSRSSRRFSPIWSGITIGRRSPSACSHTPPCQLVPRLFGYQEMFKTGAAHEYICPPGLQLALSGCVSCGSARMFCVHLKRVDVAQYWTSLLAISHEVRLVCRHHVEIHDQRFHLGADIHLPSQSVHTSHRPKFVTPAPAYFVTFQPGNISSHST